MSDHRIIPVKQSAPTTARTMAESRRNQSFTKNKLPEQLRFQQTNFATRPEPDEQNDPDENDHEDPMEGMIELPGGGYDLLLFKDMTTAQKRQFDKQQSSKQFTLESQSSSIMAADDLPV